MSITTRPHAVSREISVETISRLRRIMTLVTFAAAAAGAGFLGLLIAPILDRVIISALAVILLPMVVVVVVDFFRSPD